jgi:hypothetical protein
MTNMIHLFNEQSMPAVAAAVAGCLMVRAGATKRLLSMRAPARCAACGRRRTARLCHCTGRP